MEPAAPWRIVAVRPAAAVFSGIGVDVLLPPEGE